MKDKYIEEHFRRWMRYPAPYDTCVFDAEGDIINHAPVELCDKLVAARSRFCDEMVAIFQEHPDYFKYVTDYAQ